MSLFEMNRRTALKSIAGAGVMGGLNPLGTLPGIAAGIKPKSPKNLVIIVNVLGFNQKTFYPQGDDLNRSPLLSRLNEHHSDMTIFRDMRQPSIRGGHGSDKGILTCNVAQPDGQYVSIDQFIGDRVTQTTRHKTVHFGDSRLVWGRNSRPVNTLHGKEPKRNFDYLFSQTSSDQLNRELSGLRVALKRQSRTQLATDPYASALKEREEQLLIELDWATRPVPSVEFDTQLHLGDYDGRSKLSPFAQQLELIRLGMAKQRGQIFVATPPNIDRTAIPGVAGGYHSIGHRSLTSTAEFDEMLLLEQHLMDQFSGFLTSLKESRTLDDTIVLFLGAYSSPGTHRREYIPAILAGGGFNHQGIVDCVKGETLLHPLSHLYVSIMHAMGLDLDAFATHRGDVDRLLS